MSDPAPANNQVRAALPWVAATAIVLAVAVAAGFLVAYFVASGRAVDPPVAGASPTPRETPAVSQDPNATVEPTNESTDQPRRTPTPAPIITPEPTPFEHTIGRGESLSYVAGLYCTTVDDILAINDIPNPNRIQVGQVILIPGGGVRVTATRLSSHSGGWRTRRWRRRGRTGRRRG